MAVTGKYRTKHSIYHYETKQWTGAKTSNGYEVFHRVFLGQRVCATKMVSQKLANCTPVNLSVPTGFCRFENILRYHFVRPISDLRFWNWCSFLGSVAKYNNIYATRKLKQYTTCIQNFSLFGSSDIGQNVHRTFSASTRFVSGYIVFTRKIPEAA